MVLTGRGPETETLKKMARDLGIERYVEFPGWVSWERLLQYNKEVDIYIQVGWKPEGTSISQLYAIAFGVPSILPEGGGLEWQAGPTAIYIKNGDHDDLARAIEKLAGDSELRAKISRACYGYIKTPRMDYRQQIPLWNEKLKELIKR